VSSSAPPRSPAGCWAASDQDEPPNQTGLLAGSEDDHGIPTTGSEWGKVGTAAGIGSLAAMLLGALLGGVLGERWHSKLTRRAISGKYRPDRDHQPAERDHDRLAHDQTLDQRDRPRSDRKDDAGHRQISGLGEPTTWSAWSTPTCWSG